MKNLDPRMVEALKQKIAMGGLGLLGGLPTNSPGGAPGQPGVPSMPSKASYNPLTADENGLKTLRSFSSCPIPDESKKMNETIQICMNHEGATEQVEEILSKSLAIALRANKYCKTNLKARTVCIFSEDEKLKEITVQLKETDAQIKELQQKILNAANQIALLTKQRWDTAVETYGLNPEKFFYRIDEEKGVIEQVDLQCTDCKGISSMREHHQGARKALLQLDAEKQEKKQ